MKNQFCINKKILIQLFWNGSALDGMRNLIEKFSLEEVLKQIKNNTEKITEYWKDGNEKFTKKTINEEIANAITLADFYFLNSCPDICFEMKQSVGQAEIKIFRDFIANLENNTEIDCLIKDKEKQFKFQLKQYPEKYKKWSVNKVIEYLDKGILPESKYNNKNNKDLIIIITIKPKRNSEFKEKKDFEEIHKYLSKKDIKLLEINFLYNRKCEYMVWFQVFPKKVYYKIPYQKLSYHEAKR
jgi:hypothetical protein